MPDSDAITTSRITDAIARMFVERGDACLREFTLRTGRRVDIIAIDSGGRITIIEVKSSRQDFLSDRKWHEYPEWADRFYFAVADD
ncbi:MAG: MmcB family DNA repair protein, partial [Rhodobiaceae bacterium]